MTNFSPNLETEMTDASFGATLLPKGSAGFILPANWGAINRVMTVASTDKLLAMYGTPVYGQNHLSYATISKFLGYAVASAKVCRAGTDDFATKNAVVMLTADLTAHAHLNGTAQVRKLNAEDASYASIDVVAIELAVEPSSAWTIGNKLTVQGSDPEVSGYLSGYLAIADSTDGSAYAFLSNPSGTIAPADILVDVASVTATVTSVDAQDEQYNLDSAFVETVLTVGADEGFEVGVGMEILQGATGAVGTVVAVTSTKIYLTSVTGVFLTTGTTDITKSGDIVIKPAVVVPSGVASTATETDVLGIFARYAGTKGNDLDVAVCNSVDFPTAIYSGSAKFISVFDELSIESTELAIIVSLDGEVVEHFVVETTESDEDFIDSKIEINSNYIYTVSRTYGATTVADLASLTLDHGTITLQSLTGGASQITTPLASAKTAYDELMKKTSSVKFLADFHDYETTADFKSLIAYYTPIADTKGIFSLATLRKEAVKESNTVTVSISDFDGNNTKNFVPFYEWTHYTDSLTHKRYYIPVTGDNMAIIIRSYLKADYMAPAGTRRGVMSNTSKLYHNFDEGDESYVSDLYKYGINANVLREDLAGNRSFLLWGNRTMYNSSSDLSRLNVVMALTTDVVTLGERIRPYIFELVNTQTFALITNDCDANYLKTRSSTAFTQTDGDGGYAFACDATNNNAQTEKLKEIIVDFAVKYVTASEYLKLRIKVTSVGTSFELV